jgi:glycosyltransferase involved in cell wall biosynthesis
LATYNEERFIGAALEHLERHGVETYLIDNCSDDDTVSIAERYRGRGLAGIETLPRSGVFSLREQMRRKEQLAAELDADWFIHLDADEIRLPPRPGPTLAEALAEVDREGFNAVNFLEFSFLPTRESPDHEHPEFQRTLRTYYPFLPTFPHRLNAWKRTEAPVDLEWSGGHRIRFPGLRMYPESFAMKHYLFLSAAHAVRKFAQRRYDPQELESGWHRWRASLTPEMIRLPRASELRVTRSDEDLDPTNPREENYLAELWREATEAGARRS